MPKPKKAFIFEGVEYESHEEAGRALKRSSATIKRWGKRGIHTWADVEAMREKWRDDRRKPVFWNGKLWPSRTAAADELFVVPETMTYREKRGYTKDEDLYGGK